MAGLIPEHQPLMLVMQQPIDYKYQELIKEKSLFMRLPECRYRNHQNLSKVGIFIVKHESLPIDLVIIALFLAHFWLVSATELVCPTSLWSDQVCLIMHLLPQGQVFLNCVFLNIMQPNITPKIQQKNRS